MSVTVKVFYEKSSGTPEIRRFPLSATVAGDCFLYAVEKIKQLFPDLSSANFQLYWKDSDGDRIAFSSSEEMKDALSYVTDGILRVYIPEVKKEAKASGPASQSESASSQQQSQGTSSRQNQHKNEGPLHPGVTCDGCEGSVKGIRYKCCVCPDYDLCSNCEGKGLHSEHDMYKITTPRVSNQFGFFPPQFHQFVHTEAHNAAKAAAAAAASVASDFGRPHNSNNGGGNGQSSQSSQGGRDEYLKNVGANIAAFLDPFGIDVTYDVHHDGQQQRGQWRGGCGGRRGGSFWAGGRGCPAWENMERRAGTSKKQDEPGKTEEKKQNSNASEKMETDSQTNGQEQAGKSDIPMKDTSKEQESHAGSDEWTFVPADGSEVHIPKPGSAIPMPAPPAPTPKPEEKPSAPQEGTAHRTSGIYPDLRLQQSLQQMLSMGFTNTDNWLSDLLIENNCDIGQTLDAIKARATQQLDSLRQ